MDRWCSWRHLDSKEFEGKMSRTVAVTQTTNVWTKIRCGVAKGESDCSLLRYTLVCVYICVCVEPWCIWSSGTCLFEYACIRQTLGDTKVRPGTWWFLGLGLQGGLVQPTQVYTVVWIIKQSGQERINNARSKLHLVSVFFYSHKR